MKPAPRQNRIADLQEQISHVRAIVAERGGLVPLEMRGELKTLEADLNHERLVEAVETKGLPVPKVGDVFYISALPRQGSKQRGRSGLQFQPTVRRKVEVVEISDAELKARLGDGASIATVDGMLEILADPELYGSLTDAGNDLAGERARADAAELRAAAAEQELAELRASARRNAPDPGDGTPGRLKAAAAATAAADAQRAEHDDKTEADLKGKGAKKS